MKSRHPYITHMTCIVALCASLSFTGAIVFAGVVAACEVEPPKCGKPTVSTDSASPSSASAYLYGTVNPNGCETTYSFKYGLTTSYEASLNGNVGKSEFPSSVIEFASGLKSNTTYHYRLYATNSEGTESGVDRTFKTSEAPPPTSDPSVTTEAASEITSYGARLNGSVNPNGASTTYKFEYGTKEKELKNATAEVNIGTESKSVSAAVSLEPETKYFFRIWAKNSNGTTTGSEKNFTTSSVPWKVKTSPNPGSSHNYLYDVSCEPSTSACTSVGKSISASVDSPMALRWNGTSWSEQTAAKKSGATHTRLFGVDCPSETRCLAVGNHQSSEGPSVLSELWNEGKWNVQTTPLPTESTSSEFVAIGCSSTANCTAVGSATIGGKKQAIAERWTSPTWALSTMPIPEGAKSSQLDGVDCLWSNFCVAVGRYTASNNLVRSIVAFWNGTEWSLQTITPPSMAIEASLLDVACTPTPNRCTAVGHWRNFWGEQFTLAYRFNGVTTWTQQTTPNPASTAITLQEVSCASETSCAAVGSWADVASETTKTLALDWNGTSWSIQGSSNPAGAIASVLSGVSCRSTSCMGVGWSTNGSGTNSTLSEFRE